MSYAKVILICSLAGSLLLLSCGCGGPAKTATPVVKKYAFWPEAPDLPRIQYLRSFNSSADLRPQRSGMDQIIFGKDAPQELFLAKPYGVAMWNGRIYVCDVRGKGVVVLDLRNQQTRLMGATGSKPLQRAVDVAVAPDGRKYVADPGRAAVLVFDADERMELVLSMADSNPVSVAVYENLLYVCDQQGQHVKVLDRYTGQVLRTIGSTGGLDGQFIRPMSVRVDKSGNIYVVDIIRARVQKFAPDGTLLLAFGESGNRPGYLSKPKQTGVDSTGLIYTVDAAFDNVQVFDEQGKVMMFFGSPGPHPGAMDLPAGLTVHESDLDLFEQDVHPAFQAERLIVVTNQFGPNRVSVYAVGQLRPGKTMADISAVRAVVTAVEPTTGGVPGAEAPPPAEPDSVPEPDLAPEPAPSPDVPPADGAPQS